MMTLAGGASTNSRGKRPLPPGAVGGMTLKTDGVYEDVMFTYPDHTQVRSLLSWVGGQSGLLWGSGPFPMEIRDAIRRGAGVAQGSYGHRAEYDLADALAAALDGVFLSDKLACRFYQDGGVALAAAARLARYATGRGIVASCGYHGAAEEWAHEPSSAGILPSAIDAHVRFDWGDGARVGELAHNCAAICVEVPPCPDAEARTFLRTVQLACALNGAVFILDEVVTGFRLGLQGAAGYYGVHPDIACYGKAMSATGCVSAIVGRADLVEPIGGDVFYSTTFGGHPGPAGVAAATVDWLRENQAEAFPHINQIGQVLKNGLTGLGYTVIGQPERSVVTFPTDAEWLAWCGQMIERGVIVHRPQFPCLNHTEQDVTRTLEAAAQIARVAA